MTDKSKMKLHLGRYLYLREHLRLHLLEDLGGHQGQILELVSDTRRAQLESRMKLAVRSLGREAMRHKLETLMSRTLRAEQNMRVAQLETERIRRERDATCEQLEKVLSSHAIKYHALGATGGVPGILKRGTTLSSGSRVVSGQLLLLQVLYEEAQDPEDPDDIFCVHVIAYEPRSAQDDFLTFHLRDCVVNVGEVFYCVRLQELWDGELLLDITMDDPETQHHFHRVLNESQLTKLVTRLVRDGALEDGEIEANSTREERESAALQVKYGIATTLHRPLCKLVHCDEASEMAGLGPRVLQVLEFASTRAPELQALHELSQHDQVVTAMDAKVETQKNQRRRRANAFKSHKMPQRLRATPKSTVKGSERCRQHERRSHKLLQSRSWPQEGAPERPVWLSSHLWHAKRMNMTPKFGHMLAAQRADKSVSSALQAVRKKATLHDASYYGVIELFGLPQVILEALQLVSDPDGSDFHGLRFLAGDQEGHSMLYHEGQFPKGAIAPVNFMWRPLKADYVEEEFKLHGEWQSTKRQLWLWVHPAAYMEAATAIAGACQTVVREGEEGVQMLDRRGHLCRLKLRGRLADELVASLAKSQELKNDEEDQDMEDGAESDHDDGFLENETVSICKSSNRRNLLRDLRKAGKRTKSDEVVDTMYSVAVKDPRLARWCDGKLYHPSEPAEANLSLLHEPPGTALPEVGNGVIESPLSGLTLSSQGKNAEEPESELILKELQALLSWTTNSPNTDSSEDFNYPHLAASLERNFLQDHKLNEGIFRQRKEGKIVNGPKISSVEPHLLHLVVIRKRQPYPHTSGWDIICPPASVPSLLKALVFGGALVVGLEEDAALSTVLHQPSFPGDYPDTQAGIMYWEALASDLDAEQLKKPKSKRFNFTKHGVMSPFQPQWGSLFRAQIPACDSEESIAADEAACVLRRDKYMEPFCFYCPKNATGDSAASSSVNSIVPVPMPTLVRVVVVMPRRGNVVANAMIYAPSDEDREQFYSDSNWQGCNIELNKKNKVKGSKTDERSLIGYVTSAVYDRPKAAFRAVGFCACEPLQQLFLASQGEKKNKKGHHALAMLRTPQGRMVRPVLVRVEV
ncbi:hypothetical protein BBO99_00002407 [Phytophthora kernoviae]|uniref:Pop1 N-terminal domain-containing protein n=2 Tax=Phytophthora kernoviae TaxID=325452 RepID=A0A3R7GHK2_9STRA|nr:hypothetical protein G195_002743 [Phytophthora kernoviae 00238/432]KAG2531965.1 hypothetical protein JM16_000614 [Phytophthora kernoviae]KAG2532308.1 hypothetical protein JM18_000676 [Phytophthora kernoviae]RLN02095.1 hypothetical protein BBI17_002232 [Phytophthora kernoviae]RLN83122.1 hypothetical protein BBO99_00002407 [Phytophthora kernoviae]